MSRIERVYIATHRGDLRLTRICVTSVRRWYPEMPIFLLKDHEHGDFSTRELEETWNVKVWPTKERSFGWGFIKLEPLFASGRTRYLVLDSDIVFVGRVIDELERFDEDFVVQRELQPPSDVPALYFDAEAIRRSFAPGFSGPAFTFNTGQYVATSGVLSRGDFDDLVQWSEPRRVKHPELFNPSDQGVLNYVILAKLEAHELTVARTPFMKWGEAEMSEFELARLNDASPYPNLIHWAGLKKRRHGQMLRADILRHFERAYYAQIAVGRAKLLARHLHAEAEYWLRRALRVTSKVRLALGGLR
ncbi:MAG: hypothetical protein ABI446_04780 [Gemmatimonadaceae bacterium]